MSVSKISALGRISCEGAGNGHFFIIVVNFGFRAFWADLTLLCVKMCRFFWAEIPGKKAEIPGKRAEIPGQIHHDSKMKTWSGMFFLEMVIIILKWVNLQKMVKSNQNLPWKEICNQWISRYDNDHISDHYCTIYYFQWIGLRENLQETMVFTIKYRAFL